MMTWESPIERQGHDCVDVRLVVSPGGREGQWERIQGWGALRDHNAPFTCSRGGVVSTRFVVSH